jgi:putative membrane protein
MTTLSALVAVPLEIHGHPGGFSLLDPLLGLSGVFLVAALLVLAFLLMRRYGLLPEQLGRLRPSPEDGARRILAERMAQGEVSAEEFMERASLLNWTPGSDLIPPTRGRRRSA